MLVLVPSFDWGDSRSPVRHGIVAPRMSEQLTPEHQEGISGPSGAEAGGMGWVWCCPRGWAPRHGNKQPVGTRERGRMDWRTAVGWDEGFWGRRRRGQVVSECRKGKQCRVSQSARSARDDDRVRRRSPVLFSPHGPPVRTRGVRQTSQSFIALAARTEWEQGGLG